MRCEFTAGDGVLQKDEFEKALREAGIILNPPEYEKFFRKVDAASTNVVDYKVRSSLFYYFLSFDNI